MTAKEKVARAGRAYAYDDLRGRLRAMPIDKRAEVIVDIFRVISGEFAAMVLEHVKPPRAKARKTERLLLASGKRKERDRRAVAKLTGGG
jgi:hypothetical protein